MLRHHAPFERARVSLRARLKMASTSSVAHCLACGETTQKKDRRIMGSVSEEVNLLWTATISKELELRSKQVDFETILIPGAESATMDMKSY